MDTISRENNSYLPVAGVIVGVLALVLSGVALAKISSAKKELDEKVTAQVATIEAVQGEARNAATTADGARGASTKLAGEVNAAFQQVATEIGNLRADVTKIQESAKAAPKASGAVKGPKEPVVAGPDEYVIKAGDTFAKVARAHSTTLADVQAVNPGVDASKLKVGQKIKLPAKK
jgi:LysM repeat protein